MEVMIVVEVMRERLTSLPLLKSLARRLRARAEASSERCLLLLVVGWTKGRMIALQQLSSSSDSKSKSTLESELESEHKLKIEFTTTSTSLQPEASAGKALTNSSVPTPANH